VSDAAVVAGLKAVFTAPEQQKALDRMAALLEEQPADRVWLVEFQQLMATLGEAEKGPAPDEDAGEVQLIRQDPVDVSLRMAAAAESTESDQGEGGAASLAAALSAVTEPEAGGAADLGGAVGLRDIGSRVWRGAKEALRQFTYFQMKRRAGIVGERGLGPLCADLHAAAPAVRLHLLGHSFGGRLVSFALKGLPGDLQSSPVKSLVLLQAAFSHFAFASSLPFRRNDGGALARFGDSVDGPRVVVHSVHDTAVGVLYPAASMASGDDAAGLDSVFYRWGAMGHDGAQEVSALTGVLRAGAEPPAPPQRGFFNVDAAAVVRTGSPPVGAHSDIFHPELARLALRAAGFTATG
jgi:hypothetical protein